MSRETLNLLMGLLSQVQVQVGHPEFDRQIQDLIAAKRELAEALAQLSETPA